MYFYIMVLLYYLYGMCYLSYIAINHKKRDLHTRVLEPNDI